MEALVTGQDRAQLLQALARQLEPSLPELRSHLRTTDELASAVASVLAQAVSQIEQLLEDDGRVDDVRHNGLWYAWDSYMSERGRVPDQPWEHVLPELNVVIRSEVGSAETALGALIRVAVQAGVRAATSEPTVTEAVVEQTLADGKTKRTTVRTTRRAADEKPTRATTD